MIQKTAATLNHNDVAGGPLETSHLQITDRATEITIAAMSPYEARTVRRSAEYGDDEAALQLGMLYELGRGLPQSCAKAAEWVRKAGQLGNAAAEYNLGLRYRDGDGVEVNLQEAEHWLRKAAAHEHPRAGRALAVLIEQDRAEPVGAMAKPGQLAIQAP